MKIIGIVGASGVGKSLLCSMLENEDIPTLNTDLTAREVVKVGSPCLKELCDYFGYGILLSDGSLNRKGLANLAFSNKEGHEALNRITHFYIKKEVEKWLDDRKKEGYEAVCIDAPLLFESGLDKICYEIVGIIAPMDYKVARICERDGISRDEALLRINSQKSDTQLKELCDKIIVNNGSTDELKKAAQELAKAYKEEKL